MTNRVTSLHSMPMFHAMGILVILCTVRRDMCVCCPMSDGDALDITGFFWHGGRFTRTKDARADLDK